MKRRCDLPRSMLRRIDTNALDEAVRRFPSLIASYRKHGPKNSPLMEMISYQPGVLDEVRNEYRRLLAERDRVATQELR